MTIGGPVQYSEGFLETKETRSESLMTWADLEGELVTFNPDYSQFPSKVVYHKKTCKAEDIAHLTIEINAGEVVSFSGSTYDGTEIGGILSGESVIQLKPVSYSRHITDEVELIDLDEETY